MIIPYKEIYPKLKDNIFIAPDAWIIGDVTIDEEVSIFYGAVLRGDILPIKIGKCSNIQEHSVLHTSRGRVPTIVGENVTVGHRAILHGCTVNNNCLIGMGAIILDEAVIEENCLIGAGSMVTEGKRIPKNSLAFGSPAKVIRELTTEEILNIKNSAEAYKKVGKNSLEYFTRVP